MQEDSPSPQINSAKVRVGAGIAGAIFTIGSLLIFLFGIPVVRYLFPASIILGCALALVFHFIRRETPGAPWILAATEKKTGASVEQDPTGKMPREERHWLCDRRLSSSWPVERISAARSAALG
jgi:hypothetical protein